jgi:GT2 family glycosyltransferase
MGEDDRHPKLSVIIPVYNAESTLRATLEALEASTWRDFEVILVDDASTDGSLAIAEEYDVHVLRQEVNAGPSAARNRGAREAKGEILFFTDSDVIVRPDTLETIVRTLDGNPGFSALIGSYTIDTPCEDFFSKFKNLVHHWTHQNSMEAAITFWAGCGAIRREVFEAVGGFDEGYTTACIEDIELGYRITKAGHRIMLAKDVLVTHCKKYDFGGLVRSDVINRAIPWTALMLKERTLRSDLNTTKGNAVGLASAWLTVSAVVLSPFYPALLGFAPLFFVTMLVSNRPFFAYAYRFRGAAFMVRTIAMNFFVYLYSGVGLALGIASYLRGSQR